ncbi:MAG: ISC system 2Fe-2S type ferredoxin [Gammaproteobacteria bacterium]|nr:ISC system 2Fe-2S type ferredoxin [Gammaproteobacteria bacterium]MCP4473173.1 ISC system 2Fe-2S type ferredoxin [Gammaproteobacteria bacterium]
MPTITVLPHAEYCPQGVELEAKTGDSVLEVLLHHGIAIEHACEMQCACTTCHVYLREGYDSIELPIEQEDEMLDRAWGLDMDSRLSCQARVAEEDLVVEIPKYTLNQVSEGK